jgi:hypothetical protein
MPFIHLFLYDSARHKWEDNIEMELKETETGGMNYIHLIQDRVRCRALAYMVTNLWVP